MLRLYVKFLSSTYNFYFVTFFVLFIYIYIKLSVGWLELRFVSGPFLILLMERKQNGVFLERHLETENRNTVTLGENPVAVPFHPQKIS